MELKFLVGPQLMGATGYQMTIHEFKQTFGIQFNFCFFAVF